MKCNIAQAKPRAPKEWKRLYAKIERMKSKEELDEWLDAKIKKIFRKGGYPTEWVNRLEKR